ncbi:hypothetical protein GC170_09585 [bacterium]|nr:hypothetical protein [bacterium]
MARKSKSESDAEHPKNSRMKSRSPEKTISGNDSGDTDSGSADERSIPRDFDQLHLVCQLLRSKPLKDEGKLELRWSMRGSFFPAYSIDTKALETAVDKSRESVNRIVSMIQENPDALSRSAESAASGEPALNRVFAELAAAGNEIHNVLFPTRKEPQADVVAKWLKSLIREDRIASIEIQIEDRCDIARDGPMPAVPWNLVYDSYVDVDELTEAFETDAASSWSRFWGVRFDLSCGQNVNPLKADHRIDPQTARAVIVMDEVISGRLLSEDPARVAFDELLKRIDGIANPDSGKTDGKSEDHSGNSSKTPVVTVLHDVNELKRYVRKNGLPNLLYWLSHARPDALFLEFSEDESGQRKAYQEVNLYDLEQILSIEQEDDSEGSDRPQPPQRKLIAFLNGCQTSESSEQGSFLRSFTRFEQVSGLISTEQETLDAFAHQFGMKFLAAFFLERKPVGTILRDLRRETLPLGLLYGTYCPPAIRLAHPRKSTAPAPIPVTISDYLGQSLRKLSAASLAPGPAFSTAETRQVSSPLIWPPNPYPSLGFYTLADQALFMGREDDSARLAMTIDSPAVRILLLHGTSGSGKSSVIRAGLVPYLENHAVGYRFPKRPSYGGSVEAEQLHLFFRPSDDFTGRLAYDLIAFTAEPFVLNPFPDGRPASPVNFRSILARCIDDSKSDVTLSEVKTALDDPTRNELLCEILDAFTDAIPEKLVVTIDQAEELYTLAQGDSTEEIRHAERRRQKAFALLRGCLRGSGRWKVVLSYRTEYHGRISDGLRSGSKSMTGFADYLLTDLSRERLKAVIARPTLETDVIPGLDPPRKKYGFIYEEGVIDSIVDGIFRLRGRNTDSVLPIAQVVCSQLYEEAKSNTDPSRPVVSITRTMLRNMRDDTLRIGELPGPDELAFAIERIQAKSKPKSGQSQDRIQSRAPSDSAEPVLNILEKYAEETLSEISAIGIRSISERIAERVGWISPVLSKALSPIVSRRANDLKRLMTGLYHRQPDGSLTTGEISRRFAFHEYWSGSVQEFEEALKIAATKRLLRVDSATGSEESEEATIRLGHDTLGAVANRWAVAERRRELRNKFLIRSAAACILLAICGLYLCWNNLELTRANGLAEFEKQRADLAAEDMRKQRDRAESARAEAMAQMDLANALSANANVMLAQNLFDQGLHAEATEKLKLVQNQYRTFPWAMLRNQIRNAFTDFETKLNGEISSVVRCKDGHLLAAIGNEQEMMVWDSSDLREIRMLDPPGKRIGAIAISPDDRTIVTGHDDGSVLFWDRFDRKTVRAIPGHGARILSIAFSPDGTLLATGSDDKKVRILDSRTGFIQATYGSHAGAVTALAFSPVGKILALGSDDDSIRILKIENGKELQSIFGHRGDVNTLNFSPDGRFLASGSQDNSIILWNASSGREVRAFNGHLGGITSIAFSSDHSHLISGSRDSTVRIWDIASGKVLRTHSDLTAAVSSLAISPNGKEMVSVASDGTIRLWNLSSVTLSQKFSGHSREVGSLAISPDGRILASGSSDRTIRLWDLATGKEIQRLIGHSDWVLTVAFSPDGKSLASGSGDFEIKTWDLATGMESASLIGHEDGVRHVAFSPDGKTLASASSDRTVKLWDLATGNPYETLRGHTDWVRCIAFSPDGDTLASGSFDHSIRIWDLASRETIRTLNGHQDSVFDLAFSPDGKLLASCSADRTARLWESSTGRPIATLSGHQDVARAIAFTPDSKVLATGGDDRTVRIWDIRTAQEIRTVDFESPVYALRIGFGSPISNSTIGTRLAVASGKSISTFESNSDEIEERTRRDERIARIILTFRPLYDEARETILRNESLSEADKSRIAGIVQRLIDFEHDHAISRSMPLPEEVFSPQ